MLPCRDRLARERLCATLVTTCRQTYKASANLCCPTHSPCLQARRAFHRFSRMRTSRRASHTMPCDVMSFTMRSERQQKTRHPRVPTVSCYPRSLSSFVHFVRCKLALGLTAVAIMRNNKGVQVPSRRQLRATCTSDTTDAFSTESVSQPTVCKTEPPADVLKLLGRTAPIANSRRSRDVSAMSTPVAKSSMAGPSRVGNKPRTSGDMLHVELPITRKRRAILEACGAMSESRSRRPYLSSFQQLQPTSSIQRRDRLWICH